MDLRCRPIPTRASGFPGTHPEQYRAMSTEFNSRWWLTTTGGSAQATVRELPKARPGELPARRASPFPPTAMPQRKPAPRSPLNEAIEPQSYRGAAPSPRRFYGHGIPRLISNSLPES
jgi:hypothetical protein